MIDLFCFVLSFLFWIESSYTESGRLDNRLWEEGGDVDDGGGETNR